jgi:hypothetical protein
MVPVSQATAIRAHAARWYRARRAAARRVAHHGATQASTRSTRGCGGCNVAVTSQDLGEIVSQCGSPAGLKTLNVGLGTITLQ